MPAKALKVSGAICAAMLAAAACGSGSGDGSGGNSVIKIGVLTSLSGAASAGFTEVETGVKARLAAYKEESGACKREFEIVMADDASTPQGALAATQKLVRQDDASVVLTNTSFFYGAGQFAGTQAKETPFIGIGFDGGPQWLNKDYRNLFAAGGVVDYNAVATTMGEYWKSLGGTKVAAVSFGTPSASGAALGFVQSAEKAGLERGYVNVKIPYGSKDVGAIVLGIKNSGADVLYAPVTPDTAFAVIGGLKQAGVELKSVVLATGYGADLLKSEPAVKAGQGVGFATTTAPAEMPTPGGTAMIEALQKQTGSEIKVQSFAQGIGWVTADLFFHGLKKAGCEAAPKDVVEALRASKDWDANGMIKSKLDFSQYGGVAGGLGPGNCLYISILKDRTFEPDPKAKPVCGELTDEKVKR